MFIHVLSMSGSIFVQLLWRGMKMFIWLKVQLSILYCICILFLRRAL